MYRESRILLVEDNRGDVRLIKQHFIEKNAGCQFTVAYDGEEAITYLTEQEDNRFINVPDLIILDLNLPKVNGAEVLNYVKSADGLKVIPVVVFSSSDSIEDVDNVYNLHANCYITKPFGLDAFGKAMDDIWQFWFNVVKLPTTAA